MDEITSSTGNSAADQAHAQAAQSVAGWTRLRRVGLIVILLAVLATGSTLSALVRYTLPPDGDHFLQCTVAGGTAPLQGWTALRSGGAGVTQ